MEIKGTGRVDGPRMTRKAGSSGTSETFRISEPAEPHAQIVSSAGPITSLDSLLSLQEMDDSTNGRSRGAVQGEQLLGLLDQVRDGLLAGGIPRATLNSLAVAVGKSHETFHDPKLRVVLDEIELRAQVELAKLEQSDIERANKS